MAIKSVPIKKNGARLFLPQLKKKVVHKTTTTDDKRLQSTLKRIVQAFIAANTWVVSGTPRNKKLQDILPQIIHQLGPDNLENLKKVVEQFQKQEPGAGAILEQKDDEDEVPELVDGETFEATAEEGHTSK